MHRGKFRIHQIINGLVYDPGNVPFFVGAFDFIDQRVTASYIVAVNSVLPNSLAVALIDPFRWAICRKDQKGDILVVCFDDGGRIIEHRRAGCTGNHNWFLHLDSHAQGEESGAALIYNIQASELINGGTGVNQRGVSRPRRKYDVPYSLCEED